MKKILLTLCILSMLAMQTGCAEMLADVFAAGAVTALAAQSDQSSLLSTISDSIQSSEAICDSIMELIDWETSEYEIAVKERGASDQAEASPEEHEQSVAETRRRFAELDGYIDEIAALARNLDGLSADGQTNAGKALAAAREYFKMLGECSADLKAICDYNLDLNDALGPIVDFDPPASTTGEFDYSLFAGQLSQVVSQSQTLLGRVGVPSHIAGSHNDLVKRVDEFQAFCQDFSKSVQLSDPLRLYSCIYRLSRLEIMLDKNGSNLDDDINLQFVHAKTRLNGPISLLRGELQQNIALLSQ